MSGLLPSGSAQQYLTARDHPTAGPGAPPAWVGPQAGWSKQPLFGEEELGLAQDVGAPPTPRALQPAGGLKHPKTAERRREGDRFSRFGKKQVPAAMPEALETPHLLPPPAFPILAPKKPT